MTVDAPTVERDAAAVIDPAATADISSNASRSAAEAFEPTDCKSAAPTFVTNPAVTCEDAAVIDVSAKPVRSPSAAIVAAAVMSANALRFT